MSDLSVSVQVSGFSKAVHLADMVMILWEALCETQHNLVPECWLAQFKIMLFWGKPCVKVHNLIWMTDEIQ